MGEVGQVGGELWADRRVEGSDRHDARDPNWDAYEVFHVNAIARFEIVADDGLRSNARDGNLAVGIVDVGKEHIPRHLAVNAHRLYLLQNSVARSF